MSFHLTVFSAVHFERLVLLRYTICRKMMTLIIDLCEHWNYMFGALVVHCTVSITHLRKFSQVSRFCRNKMFVLLGNNVSC